MSTKKVFSVAFAGALLIGLGTMGLPSVASAHALPQVASASQISLPTLLALPVPPPTFDPLTATASQLQQYGFPPRPSNSSELAVWKQAMEHAKHFVAPDMAPVATESISETPISNSTVSGPSYGNWAGYAINSSANNNVTYSGVSASRVVPTVAGNSAYPESDDYGNAPTIADWVGAGGNPDYPLFQEGTISIATTTPKYWFFTEYAPDQGPQRNSALTVSGGDTAFADETYDSSEEEVTYFEENETTDTYSSVPYRTASWNGSSAEFEAERPTSNTQPIPDFGNTTFTGCEAFWNNNSDSGNIADLNVQEDAMGTGLLNTWVSPGSIDSSSWGFTDSWISGD